MQRTMIFMVAAVLAACGVEGNSTTVQAVAGPGGVTVTARAAADQLAVNWSPDVAAVKYYVLRSSGGGAFAFVASILDSSGGTPPTSFVDTGLTAGIQYCYALESAYPDGTTSAMGTAGCDAAVGSPPVTAGAAAPIIPGTQFTLDQGSATLSGATWTFIDGQSASVVYGYVATPGTVITDVVWSAKASAPLMLAIARRSFGDGGATTQTMCSTPAVTATTSVAHSANACAVMPIAIAPGFEYTLSVTAAGAATFDGVQIVTL